MTTPSGSIRILGLDPGFAETGWCLADYDGSKLFPVAAGLIRTKKAARRLAADDNIRRTREIWQQLEFIVADSTGAVEVDLVASEAMSYPPSASTAAKMSLCFGAIAALCQAASLPFIQFSPGHIKLVSAGTKKASKADMANALGLNFPGYEDIMEDVPPGKREHCWDALGAAVASLDTEIVRMGVRREAKR